MVISYPMVRDYVIVGQKIGEADKAALDVVIFKGGQGKQVTKYA